MTPGAVQTPRDPMRVADELKWDLLRDEWELLLAIGSGPTTVEAAAKQLCEDLNSVQARVHLLCGEGLLKPLGNGYAMVEAFYQRQEGMASYLRDLVLKRLGWGEEPPPVAGLVRDDLGGSVALESLLERADSELFPRVVQAANRPESERSQRFAVYFAASADCGPAAEEPEELIAGLLRVVRSAAVQRSQGVDDARSAKLWIAEMRTDPEVAD